MTRLISIDPGKCKCGIVLADMDNKEILKAIVIKSSLLSKNIQSLKSVDKRIKVIMGNGTTSKEHAISLDFLGDDLCMVDEKNTTFRAKQRYFEIFPLRGFKRLFPREFFIKDINLDAISALIILEDHLNYKFSIDPKIDLKTWLKQ